MTKNSDVLLLLEFRKEGWEYSKVLEVSHLDSDVPRDSQSDLGCCADKSGQRLQNWPYKVDSPPCFQLLSTRRAVAEQAGPPVQPIHFIYETKFS